MKTGFCVPVMFALMLCGCGPRRDYRFIELPSVLIKDPIKPLSPDQVREDVSQVLYALDTGYSGKRFLPAGEFEKLRRNVASIRGPRTPAALCAELSRILNMASDNHLKAFFNDEKCVQQEASRTATVGANSHRGEGVPWEVRSESRGNSAALLISIVSFPAHTSTVWDGFIDRVRNELVKADLIVLDIRGNEGGDDGMARQLSTLLAGQKIKTPYAPQWTNESPEACQLFVNLVEHWIRKDADAGKTSPRHILDLKKKFADKRDRLLRGRSAPEIFAAAADSGEPAPFDFKKSVKKPIYILIDAHCSSSCESAIDFFEFNALATTVGERTAGYIHFGNNGRVYLKNSGVSVQLAISFNRYLDLRFLEKTGIPPEIAVPAGRNALDYAWADYLSKKSGRAAGR